MKFSERFGYAPVRQTIQLESVDLELRNSLWTIFMGICERVHRSDYGAVFQLNPDFKEFCEAFWFAYFKRPLDNLEDRYPYIYGEFREYFFKCKWFEVYDFIEFAAQNYPYGEPDKFISGCNFVLEREMSAYRFIGSKIAQITAEEEISAIEEAIQDKQDPIRIHLQLALDKLSDRKKPDYRNSIKESISSVESLVQTILGKKGTLGDLIKKLKSEIDVHPAMGNAFSSLYGYASDESGIRHAILDAPSVGFEEAKFFLVVCSAFVNFVRAKIKA